MEAAGNGRAIRWEAVSAVIWEFTEKDPIREGLYRGATDWAGGKYDPCKQHFIEDFDGVVWSFVPGAVMDKKVEEANVADGTLVRFRFLGRRELKGGGKVNLWMLQRGTEGKEAPF